MHLEFAPHECADLPVDSQKRASTPDTVGSGITTACTARPTA